MKLEIGSLVANKKSRVQMRASLLSEVNISCVPFILPRPCHPSLTHHSFDPPGRSMASCSLSSFSFC